MRLRPRHVNRERNPKEGTSTTPTTGRVYFACIAAGGEAEYEPAARGGKRMLQGLIMDMPLMISSAIQHAAE
ncbi:MAG: hypothetical protein DMD77_28670, partial [Candidatus Rokuibacteriota bacterium]